MYLHYKMNHNHPTNHQIQQYNEENIECYGQVPPNMYYYPETYHADTFQYL